jgi:hypothetical protein
MGLRQDFRFKYENPEQLQAFLRSLAGIAKVDDRGEFFVFTPKSGLTFSFDCEIQTFGLRTDRDGEYFGFLGQFIEALTGEFGRVELEDS